MQEVKITKAMKEIAAEKARVLPSLNNSIMQGQGNYVGFLGEEVTKQVLGCLSKNTYDYDLVLPNGKTVEVKTKRTGVKPKLHYECSVASYNTKQSCDYYAFVRVNDEADVAWFLGVYKKEDYYKDAKLLKKGEIDSSNNFTVRADCYNLPISALEQLK